MPEKSYKVEIVIATIGLIGVLGAAIIANWEKLFSLKSQNSSQLDTPKPSPNKSVDPKPSATKSSEHKPLRSNPVAMTIKARGNFNLQIL